MWPNPQFPTDLVIFLQKKSLMKTSFFVQCCTFQTTLILYYPFLSYRANVLCICQMNWVIITQDYSFLLYYRRRQHQGSSLGQVFLNLLLHKRLFKIFCLNLSFILYSDRLLLKWALALKQIWMLGIISS